MKKMLFAAALGAVCAQAAAAETYVIDPTHTYPMFEISHLGFSTTRGGFNKTDGKIVLDRANKTGTVEITIDANSLTTPVQKLDEHLKNEDFFDVAKYPTISFKADRLVFDGDRLAAVPGELTMHGVTRPVTLTVTHFVCKEHPMLRKPHCGADAEATIRRSDWGISAYSPAVGEEVKLKIQVEATRQ
ncbi:YceI family protein [Sinimarinibacterium thermocellulolyticum]|uniref:YceI family protein n=1 Tax=Sinimarinibacterium thermocellulolyticum TaxID=3170016 RepID=A0ABV2ADJ9_9GAMM